MSFLRTTRNFLAGRRKVVDEEVLLSSVEHALTKLDHKKNPILLDGENCRHRGYIPHFIPAFLNCNFKYSEDDKEIYVDCRHQVYSGKRKEKHYFDLEKGRVFQVSDEESIHEPFRRATFTWLSRVNGGQDGKTD